MHAAAVLIECVSVRITASVPTSFEGPFGKISYRVRAVIDTPRFSKDYKTQRPFYLLNLLNLNEVPEIEVRGPQNTLLEQGLKSQGLRPMADISIVVTKNNGEL